MKDKIEASHRDRRAIVYLRQSTLKQVVEHRESTARQYALRQRALDLGWRAEHIVVIDDDLGHSGGAGHHRDGFQRLAEDVARGRVGAILALEVSRLSRSSADWHRLLELCHLADVVLIDEQATYTPRDPNDRLLLGLKGTMSEAEQYWMRLRLRGGSLNKARRGELFFVPAGGYVWDRATSRFRLDPDESVQRAVGLVFERFRVAGSARGVVRYFERHGLQLPVRGPCARELRWVPPKESLILNMLHNPIFAGAYVYGRNESRVRLVDGQMVRGTRRLSQDAWSICLRDWHPAYLPWDEFMANQRKLDDNRTWRGAPERRSASREGSALLQGLLLCGRCAHRMHTQYAGPSRRGVYQCKAETGHGACWSVPARALDDTVVQLFLDAVKPTQIELGLAVLRESEDQAAAIDRQWALRLERARYEARLAERRYKAVDPDNRVIARTLEREWNEKLTDVEHLERERLALHRREAVALSAEDRATIVALSKDLPRVWRAPTTTNAERKNLLRLLIREITLTPIDVPTRQTRVQVLWQTGAVSEVAVPRADKFAVRATPAAARALVRRTFRRTTDAQLADELNRRGVATGAGVAWTPEAVRRLRYAEGWHRPSTCARRAPARNARGLWSVHAVAEAVGVTPGTVRLWVAQRVLEPVQRGGPGRPAWFRIDDATLERLRGVHAAMRARRTPSANSH
jgi:DNA invertase Pin-like site-specific DNA recombinase